MKKRNRLSKELVAASSRPTVLAILSRGESYGYDILKQVKELSGHKLEWSDGMLYPVLHRLEREGLITSRWQLSGKGRPRKYYSMTKKGAAQMDRDRRDWDVAHGTMERAWSYVTE